MTSDSRKQVADLWDKSWELQKKRLPKQYGLSRLNFRVLKKEIGCLKGKKIFEAGSGTGLTSLLLASKGAGVTLLDISPNAIEISRNLFEYHGLDAEFKCASVFEIPYADNYFDVVWNAGVIEHFKENEQEDMLKEMIRVCRNDGRVLLLNPNDRAPIYKFGKNYAEKISKWGAGDEYPVVSLVPMVSDLDAKDVNEYSVGFLQQLNFLEYFFQSKALRLAWIAFYRIVQRLFWFLDYLPGYLLVTSFKKK